MSLQIWILFVLTETVLCLTPGPAVLLVLSQGLSRGRFASLYSSVGILAANTVYFLITATGLGSLLLASYRAFVLLKWIGAVYLIWIGVRTFAGKSSDAPKIERQVAEVPPSRDFLRGFILQVTKPGLLVYFGALLPQFFDPSRPIAMQVAILGLTSIAIEFVVLAAYGTLAGLLSAYATGPRFETITNRLAGTMLVAAGARMAAIRDAR